MAKTYLLFVEKLANSSLRGEWRSQRECPGALSASSVSIRKILSYFSFVPALCKGLNICVEAYFVIAGPEPRPIQ